MTRINAHISPVLLTDQHLKAELREITRPINKVKNKYYENNLLRSIYIPNEFCLGKGHETFFYNKGFYLWNRYNLLYNEVINRNIKWSYYPYLFTELPIAFFEGYFNYNEKSNNLIKNRITERIINSKQHPRYYGKIIDKEKYIKEILNFN